MDKVHVESLASKHAQVEARIELETHRPQPDMMLVSRLKKQKLRLKDNMLGH